LALEDEFEEFLSNLLPESERGIEEEKIV